MHHTLRYFALCLFLVGVGTGCSWTSEISAQLPQEAEAPAGPAFVGDLPAVSIGSHRFFRRILDNGLHAVAVSDEAEKVSVFMVIGAGKRQETSNTTGLAHLTEHAMYTGTAKLGPGEHDQKIKAWGGKSNAFTREDTTLFYDDDLPVEKFEEALAMEADRLRGLRFDRKAIKHERERLRDEEEWSWQPTQRRTELLEAAVFKRHPYGAGVLNKKGHTRAAKISRRKIRQFYDRYYQPGNTAVVVVGHVDPKLALDAIEAAFGALPVGPPPWIAPEEPEITERRSVEIRSTLRVDRLEWVWLIPPRSDPDRPALDLIARLLSRRRTISGEPISASMGDRLDRDLFRLAATGPDAEQKLDGVLQSFLAGGVSEEELAQAKQLQRSNVSAQPLRAKPYVSLAAAFGAYEVFGQAELLAGYEDAIDGVSRQDLLRIARRVLDPGRYVAVRFLGTGEEMKPLPEDAGALQRAAMDAEEAGDLERAAAAYTKLLGGNPSDMNRVIYLGSRGQIYMKQRDYDAAIADFEQALALFDYPAVREILDEARARKLGVPPPDDSPKEDAARPSEYGKNQSHETHGKADTPDVELMARVDTAKRELEAWRELLFSREIVPEILELREDKRLAGWYEPDGGRLVVVRGQTERFARGAFLHEMQHALQDHNWHLKDLEDAVRTTDEQHALTALIEGEAMLAVSEILNYDFERHAVLPEKGEVSRGKFEKIYEYGFGLRFVRALREQGGWVRVNQVWEHPPQSAAEVFSPEKYPLPESEDFAPFIDRGDVIDEDRLGEFELRWLLVRDEQTRALADQLGPALVVDLWRHVRTDTPPDREFWDLRFRDEQAARTFVEQGRPALDRENWQVRRRSRDVRLQRQLLGEED